MKSLKFVIKENIDNLYRIFKLSFYDFIAPLRDTYLGVIWIVLGPLLQIGVYWIVFGLGIRGGKPVDGHPFLLWMLSGLVPWFFISGSITSGALCIYSKASILTKMKFPTSIIPTYNTVTQLMNNIPVLLITLIVFAFNGYKGTIYYIQLIYYIIAASILVTAITFITSSLVMAIRDINRIIGTIIRFIFYLSPILWVPSNLPKILMYIIELNPINYIINGFRDSLLYNKWFWSDIKSTLYFWGITLILLIIGSLIHMRLRTRFSDLL